MASQLLGIKTRFTNDLGSPLVGGQVYTYFAGTSTHQDSYSDAELTVPNTNPVILDDTGSADIFLKGVYRIRVFDKSGRFIEEQDNVTQAASQGDATELANKVNTVETDLSKVKFDTGITATAKNGGVARTQASKNSDTLSVKDFGAKGDYDTDDTIAIENAFAACKSGDVLHFPRGVYRVTKSLRQPEGVQLKGDGSPTFNITVYSDDKKYLRPGYKHLLPGSSIVFSGTQTAIKTTSRADNLSSFGYMFATNYFQPAKISGLGFVMDVDCFDADGSLTTATTDNRANYDVGFLVDDSMSSQFDDIAVFGYFAKNRGLVLAVTQSSASNPDYNSFVNCDIFGGLAIVGWDNRTAVGREGLSGTTFIGCKIHDQTHHSRSTLTVSDLGSNVIFIDGTVSSASAINGHMFIGCCLRGTVKVPIQLDNSDNFSLLGCTTEFVSNSVYAPETTQFIEGTTNTQRVVLSGCRHAGTVQQLNIRRLAGQIKGPLVVDDSSAGVSYLAKNQKGIVYGASDETGNDPIMQFANSDFSSITKGWNIRFSTALNELQFNYNGSNKFSVSSAGNIKPAGRLESALGAGKRETQQIASGIITISGTTSFIAVRGEGNLADDLDEIQGGVDGDMLTLVAYSSSQPISIKHNTAKIRLKDSTDFLLNTIYSNITLMYHGGRWFETARTVLA